MEVWCSLARSLGASALALSLGLAVGCGDDSAYAAEDVEIDTGMLQAFQPALPDRIETPDNALTDEKIDLGRKLFYEPRISANQAISCNTCHQLDNYGVDNLAGSPGFKDQVGDRVTPTVYNVAGHFTQFWDGRIETIEEQAIHPVINPIEMAMTDEDYVMEVLQSIPGYVELFEEAFPEQDEPVNVTNFGQSLGAFQRTLTTRSPWDEFLAGDEDALTPEQKAGFNEFVAAGCITCHMGTYVGGSTFQKLGLVNAWPNQDDQGRYEVTGNDDDRMFFKVAGLRNVTETAPYFHDGSTEDLHEAVRKMAYHQTNIDLTDEQVDRIVAWLGSLTGDIPTDRIAEPDLPPSGPDTPGPLEE